MRTIERERVEVRSRLTVVERSERIEREPAPHVQRPTAAAPLLQIGTIDVYVAAPPPPVAAAPGPVPVPPAQAASPPAAPAGRLSRPAPIFGLAQG